MEINTSQVGQDFAASKVDFKPAPVATDNQTLAASEPLSQSVKGNLQTADTTTQAAETDLESIETAVTQLSDFVQTNNRQLNFSVDEGSDKQVVKVTDSQSGELIRQIPSEEVLKLSERLQDLQTEVGTAVGLLFNKQV